MALVLMIVGFTNIFACESIFDHIDGITCELQYTLCSEYNQDIKVCREVKDKVKRVKKDIKEINKKFDKLESEYKKAEVWEKKATELEKSEAILAEIKLLADEAEVLVAKDKIYEDFIGTEVLQMLNSEKFIDDVNKVLQGLQK